MLAVAARPDRYHVGDGIPFGSPRPFGRRNVGDSRSGRNRPTRHDGSDDRGVLVRSPPADPPFWHGSPHRLGHWGLIRPRLPKLRHRTPWSLHRGGASKTQTLLAMRSSSPAAQPPPSSSCHGLADIWFWAWAVVGAAAALGIVSLGPFGLGPALIGSAALSISRNARRSIPGLLAGAGLRSSHSLLTFNAEGHGTSCWHTATAGGCDQHLNPVPWLVIALLLLWRGSPSAGAAKQLTTCRSQR